MIKIYIDGNFHNQIESDFLQNWRDDLTQKLENYNCELFFTTGNFGTKLDFELDNYEKNYNCESILYIISNPLDVYNYKILTNFIDDCWKSNDHACNIKYVSIYLLLDDEHKEDTYQTPDYQYAIDHIGKIMDLGVEIAPNHVNCSFISNLDDIVKTFKEIKMIEEK